MKYAIQIRRWEAEECAAIPNVDSECARLPISNMIHIFFFRFWGEMGVLRDCVGFWWIEGGLCAWNENVDMRSLFTSKWHKTITLNWSSDLHRGDYWYDWL